MSLTVYIALIGCIPVIVGLFILLPPRRAILLGSFAAWMFLPHAFIRLPGMPDYGKSTAISLGVLLGILLVDRRTLFRWRPKWVDLPMITWCLVPVATSLSNNLGFYDGVSETWRLIMKWGVPFVVGRLYFCELPALRDLNTAFLLGVIVYVPLCWLEVRLSPQLHQWTYGFSHQSFDQHGRYGGYRPLVFMEHGIAVAIWIMAGTIILFWFWRAGIANRIFGIPVEAVLSVFIITLVLGCKSLGPILLTAGGVLLYFGLRLLPPRLPLVAMALLPAAYMTVRSSEILPAKPLVDVIRIIDKQRASSLGLRLYEEDHFTDHAWHRPWVGWGGWMRSFPRDEYGRLVAPVDAFWISALCKHGMVGLVSSMSTMLIGVTLFICQVPARYWMRPEVMPATALVVVVLLYVDDTLFNGLLNPLFIMAAGGLTSFSLKPLRVPTAGHAADATQHKLRPGSRRLVTGHPEALQPRE